MAKSVSITLPNGRTWPRKGDAIDHFKAILARYAIGSRVLDATDHADLAALLEVYDSVLPPEQPAKAGTGVAYFEKRLDVDHPGHTSCFFVVRKDGSSIDFSFRGALNVAGKQTR